MIGVPEVADDVVELVHRHDEHGQNGRDRIPDRIVRAAASAAVAFQNVACFERRFYRRVCCDAVEGKRPKYDEIS